jgi:hypothetical protein
MKAIAWGSEEDHVLPALQEPEIVERVELLTLDRRLEGEVEVGDHLHGRQPARAHRRLQPAVVTQADLSTEQGLDGLGRRELTPVDLGEDLVERLERSGHLQIGELRADPVAP